MRGLVVIAFCLVVIAVIVIYNFFEDLFEGKA